jgi:hypothetical protein
MDLRRLRAGEWIAVLSGAVLLVSLFLPWYRRGPVACIALVGQECPNPERFTGFEAFSVIDWVLAAVGLFAIAVFLVTLTQRTAALPIAMDALLTIAGAIAAVIVLIRLLNIPDGLGPHVERSGGAWVALAGALGTAVGAWLAMRDERRGRPGESADAANPPMPPPEPAR